MGIREFLCASLLAAGLAAGAHADPPRPGDAVAPAAPRMAVQPRRAAIRTGTHPEFGRVVIDLPAGVTAAASADGADGVLVRVAGGTLGAAGAAPRNVTAIAVAGAEARLTLAPGARFTVVRLPAHLVIDVFAKPGAAMPLPPPATVAATAVVPAAAPVTSAASIPAVASAPKLAPKAGHPARFSGPPPRRPAAAAAPAEPARAGARPAPATPTPAPIAAPIAAPAPGAPMPGATAPAPPPGVPPPAPLDIAAGRPEMVRVPLQSLLSGNGLPSVLRPPPARPSAPAGAPLTAPVTAVERTPLAAPGGGEAHGQGAPGAGGGKPAGPVALAAEAGAEALQLPFDATTGAAAFRRGGEVVVVFDERRPIDLAALRGSQAAAAAFADARVQLLETATVLRLRLPPEQGLRLSRDEDGWTLTRVAPPPALQPIRGDIVGGAMQLAAAAPGNVVSVPDPLTGDALLVGTQIQPGQGVPVTRHTPDFKLLETLQGVAVDPVSDAITLHVAPGKQFSGFVLAAGNAQAAAGVALDPLGPEALAALEAAHMTRRWDFPALPTSALRRRLEAAIAAAAAAPPEGRTARRLQVVQTHIALGMGAEANAIADFAIGEDARAADSPDAAGLAAVGALLAGRLDQTNAIADPRLDGTDEVTLWRAVRLALQHEGAPDAAQRFAATLPLLLAYPAALRQRLLPLAAETMVLGGERAAARRLLEARKDDGALDFARGLLAELEGHAAPALAIYDRLAQSPDRRERARAAVRAAELRLRIGATTVAQAADALDKLIYAWRGGPEELALRLRVADLRAKSGHWRAALALLRETAGGELGQNWPGQQGAIRDRMGAVFSQALAGEAALSPLDLASLVDENPDLLPDGEPGRVLAARLADRLVALDLPKRAAPVLEKLMNATAAGAAKAELGARLAAVRLEQGDPAAALLALSASTATDLPPALDEARTIAFARAMAARGALAPATTALAALNSPAADEARATLLEQAKDWPAAVQALTSFAGKTVPADGALAQVPAQVLLRLASAAAQANDEPLLAQLRERELSRMPSGKIADLFRMLTERPVQGVADLPRAAQEAALARDVPAALKSIGSAAPTR